MKNYFKKTQQEQKQFETFNFKYEYEPLQATHEFKTPIETQGRTFYDVVINYSFFNEGEILEPCTVSNAVELLEYIAREGQENVLCDADFYWEHAEHKHDTFSYLGGLQ